MNACVCVRACAATQLSMGGLAQRRAVRAPEQRVPLEPGEPHAHGAGAHVWPWAALGTFGACAGGWASTWCLQGALHASGVCACGWVGGRVGCPCVAEWVGGYLVQLGHMCSASVKHAWVGFRCIWVVGRWACECALGALGTCAGAGTSYAWQSAKTPASHLAFSMAGSAYTE
eukprot:scaffold75613_cov24-Tisochrysis_lutea.AAC.2